MVKAVFLDRDGVINKDHGYTYRIDDFEFLPGVPQALSDLKVAGYLLIVVTNQSGVARGMYSLEDVARFHHHMQSQLAIHNVALDEIYVCPHHTAGKVPEYSIACDCRKPGTAMVQRARSKHRIDLSRSYLVGDKFSDIACAHAAGLTGIQVLGRESKVHPAAAKTVTGLPDAVAYILDH